MMPQGDWIAVHLAMYANVAWGHWLWGFDVLVAFSATFAILYGLAASLDRLRPLRLGDRPRVWVVPVTGAVALACFYGFMDHAVSATLRDVWGWMAPPVPEWIWILAVVWGLGCAIALGRIAVRAARIGRTARRLPTAPDDSIFRRARTASGARGRATLRVGAAGTPVVACGWWRTYVVVPADFDDRFTPDERYAMLLHEGVHLRHRDAWTLALLSVARSVFWFDPVMRHAIRRMKAALELRCDWTVVNTHHQDAVDYAALIVKTLSARQALTAGFSDDYRHVAHRLGHILRDGGIPPPRRLSRAGALGLLAGVLGLGLGAVGYAHRPGTAPTYPSHADYRAMLAEAEKALGLAPSPDPLPGMVYFRARIGIFGGYTQVRVHAGNEKAAPAPGPRRNAEGP